MLAFLLRLACLLSLVLAIDGIVAPSIVTADEQFEVTFETRGSDPRDQYRVFLAAASVGQNGPMCYLRNLTYLTSPFNATIPASVGPNANDYSIGIADITTGQGATFGNKFNFTGGTGEYSAYEKDLGGAPFWSPYDLPCSAIACARKCAEASYPASLTDGRAYRAMTTCIIACPGVSPGTTTSRPDASGGAGAPIAVVTLASDVVVTAWQTVVTSGSVAITQAIVGNQTLTLGSAVQTLNSAPVSLATGGVVVGGSSTVAFSTTTPTSTSSTTPSSESTGSGGQAAHHSDKWLAAAGCAVYAALVL